jgi:DNA-binding MurR/RpiR family transcriptional regulator
LKATAKKSALETEPNNVVELSSKLPEKQEKVIAALVSCASIKEAAEKSKVSETTIWRYMQDAAFMEEYRAARRKIVEHALVRLQHDADGAAGVLMEVAQDVTAPASARVAAARTILERAMHTIDQDELQARIDRLEEHLTRKANEPPAADTDDEDEDDD